MAKLLSKANGFTNRGGKMAEEVAIGVVSKFFARPVVAGIDLSAELRVGDKIHIKGHTTDLTLVVQSIQIQNVDVEEAKSGDEIGVKVPDRVRPGDNVYKVVE
jgi:putative protease